MLSWLVVVVALVWLKTSEGATTLGYAVSGTTLRDLLQTAGLMDELNNGGPYTLFVPSDTYLHRFLATQGTSLSTLKQDPAALKEFLLYHVVNGTITRDMLDNEVVLTSLNGHDIRVNNYADKVITVQGARLQNRDTVASNGLIHYLYAPLLPSNGTVADVVGRQSDLTKLMAAAHASGIDEFLADQDPVTLFAPTDAAFAALGDKLDTLMQNPELLAEILQYHVVPGTIYSSGFHTEDLHTFEEADRLHILSRYGSVYVDGTHLVRNGVDLSAVNGVVHKIDHVLIPPSLKDQL